MTTDGIAVLISLTAGVFAWIAIWGWQNRTQLGTFWRAIKPDFRNRQETTGEKPPAGTSSTQKYVLLLDQDGPLADFDRHLFEQTLDADIDMDQLEDQRYRYMTDHCVSRAAKRRMRAVVEADGFYRNLPVTPGAQKGVQALLDSGRFEIWVCTKPMEANLNCLSEKAHWLNEHFPMLDGRIITARDKTMVRGHVLLDDAPKLPGGFEPVWLPLIFPTPWNGVGSKWEQYGRWGWGDDIEDLIEAIERHEKQTTG